MLGLAQIASRAGAAPGTRSCAIFPVSIGDRKLPHYIHKHDGSPVAFAGLWETWKGSDEGIESCTIITTTANAMMAKLHDHMRVILDPEHFNWWMAGPTDDIGQLLVPSPSEEL
jgi:putative SOS response-associated peptidase YedK